MYSKEKNFTVSQNLVIVKLGKAYSFFFFRLEIAGSEVIMHISNTHIQENHQMGHTRTFSNLEVKDAPEDQTLWPPDGPSHWVVIPGFIQNSEHAIYSPYCGEINQSFFF